MIDRAAKSAADAISLDLKGKMIDTANGRLAQAAVRRQPAIDAREARARNTT